MKNGPTLQEFDKLILNRKIVVPNEQWVTLIIEDMTEHAMAQDIRDLAKGKIKEVRPWHVAYSHSENKVLEIALSQIDGFALNPFVPDYTIPRTYAYDCVYYGHGKDHLKTFEVKRHKKNQSWWTYPNKAIYQLLDKIKLIDYIVTGSYDKTNDGYTCSFHMIMKGSTFPKYLMDSPKEKYSQLYKHLNAGPNNCIYTDRMSKGKNGR